MDLERRLDHQIELVENDESLTDKEKAEEIRELYKEAREFRREQRDQEERDYTWW